MSPGLMSQSSGEGLQVRGGGSQFEDIESDGRPGPHLTLAQTSPSPTPHPRPNLTLSAH